MNRRGLGLNRNRQCKNLNLGESEDETTDYFPPYFFKPAIHKNINYTGRGDFLQGCTAARLGKTIRVALSWHRDGGGIYTLNVPSKPTADTWTTTLLSTTVSTPPQGEDLNFGDIDRDGDLDLLLGDLWLRNDGNPWPTIRMGKITSGEPDRVDLADINGDGKLDAVVALENGTDIWWFEGPDDPTGTWTQHKLGVIAIGDTIK